MIIITCSLWCRRLLHPAVTSETETTEPGLQQHLSHKSTNSRFLLWSRLWNMIMIN